MRAVEQGDVGWQIGKGADYSLPFYTHGKEVSMRKAKFIFIGVAIGDDGRARLAPQGAGVAGGAFTGVGGDKWDSSALYQYIGGPGVSLDALLQPPYTTRDHGTNGFGAISDANAVDLAPFERVAQSFDRTKQFFTDHAAVLNAWEKALDGHDSAWQGSAAGVFRNLLHTLRTTYDDYVRQMGGADFRGAHRTLGGYTPTSTFGDAMAQAQQALATEAKRLYDAWYAWSHDANYVHDPHHATLTMLDRVAQWVWENNISQVNVTHNGRTPYYHTANAFKEDLNLDVPELGRVISGGLQDSNTWKQIGQAAVDLWNLNVEKMLVPAAETALSNLNNAWADISSTMGSPLQTTASGSLSQQSQEDQLGNGEKQADQSLNQLNNKVDQLNPGLGGGLDVSGADNPGSDTALNAAGGQPHVGGDSGSSALNGLGGPTGSDGLTLPASDTPSDAGGAGQGAQPSVPLNSGLMSPPSGGGAGAGGGTGRSSSSPLNPGLHANSVTNPDGSTTRLNPDGSLTTINPDGSTSSFNPETGKLTTTTPDGNETVSDLGSGRAVTDSGGTSTKLNSNGTLTTRFPDGTSTTIDPRSGLVSTTSPDGSVSTTRLNPALSPDTSLPLGDPSGRGAGGSDLTALNPGLGALQSSGGLGSSGGLAPAVDIGTAGGEAAAHHDEPAYDEFGSNVLAAGALGAPGNGSSGSGSGSMPLNPMSLGGMGGMGGMGGGGQSSNERVRNVLTDPAGPTTGRRTGRQGRRAGDEADVIHTHRRLTTSSSAVPASTGRDAGQGAQVTQGSGPGLVDWAPEDEDIWGTDEGGAPVAIGR